MAASETSPRHWLRSRQVLRRTLSLLFTFPSPSSFALRVYCIDRLPVVGSYCFLLLLSQLLLVRETMGESGGERAKSLRQKIALEAGEGKEKK